MKTRMSRKRVNEILEVLTYKGLGYQLIVHDYCGTYKYSICKYTREPKYVDPFGKIVTWNDWKYEETLLHTRSLRKCYDLAMELCTNVDFEKYPYAK